MKVNHPITVDRECKKALAGGDWEELDSVSKGCVQILSSGSDPKNQAITTIKELERKSTLDADWDWSNAAVIAREWKFLEPLRSYCELNGFPVQMADEQPPPIWRLRETRRLMDWLESRNSNLVGIADIREWIYAQGSGRWWEQLEKLGEALSLEVGDAEIPVKYFVEWLVEFGREIRTRQVGLLLLTAHRAKGLEFDHVAVLDGNWQNIGNGEDRDAARRLYYVAMSRAKQTLSLLRFSNPHPFLDALDTDRVSIVERDALNVVQQGEAVLDRRYLRLTLKDIDIGFAGRFDSEDTVHTLISALKPGDELRLKINGNRWDLADEKGAAVGRFSKAFTPPKGMRVQNASVIAIVQWSRKDTAVEYQSHMKSDQWEVVLPELIFAP